MRIHSVASSSQSYPGKLIRWAYKKLLRNSVHYLYFRELISRTNNFGDVKWLGHPVWQNVHDLWTIQEVVARVRPSLLIETGTNRGGSSLFFANLFDLMGAGEIITIDVARLHALSHPRVTYLIGSSTSEEVVQEVHSRASVVEGAIMVILDSDHSRDHVLKELESYAPLVTPGSYVLVQDGLVDTMGQFRNLRPGPLPAIDRFLESSDSFELDSELCERFLVTHHPRGWLRRRL